MSSCGACAFRSTTVDSPRNYLTKLIRYPRLLEATNSISQLRRVRRRHLRLLGKARSVFGTYNVTNPGTGHDARSGGSHDRKAAACIAKKDFVFFKPARAEFMQTAAKTPRSRTAPWTSAKLAGRRHPDDRSPRRPSISALAEVEEGGLNPSSCQRPLFLGPKFLCHP